ncbi:FbpB family small basic protein [uncultured Metabacillus sp.]|nr:FbpB family small basic protein [uncultured Metabacillus sp.]
MRKNKKRTFEELVLENKQQLLKDQEALARIEERWEQKMLRKLD